MASLYKEYVKICLRSDVYEPNSFELRKVEMWNRSIAKRHRVASAFPVVGWVMEKLLRNIVSVANRDRLDIRSC